MFLGLRFNKETDFMQKRETPGPLRTGKGKLK